MVIYYLEAHLNVRFYLMSCDLMCPQGTAHSGLGLAWSDSGGTGANWPSGPAADHRGPRAEGRLGQWVSGAEWEAILQEAGPEQGASQRHRLLSLLLQGCQGHHWWHHCCQRLCLCQGWVTSPQTHTHTQTIVKRSQLKLKIFKWLVHLAGSA